MRRRVVLAASVTGVAGLSSMLLVGAAAASAVPSAVGGWHAAIEIPRTAFLNKGGTAQVYSVSCAAGSCLAGGYYIDGSGHAQPFVVTEAKGRWGKAIQAPGTAVLDKGGVAQINSVSCAAAGSCAAGGFYRRGTGGVQAFLVTETKGHWSKAIQVPGAAALNTGGDAETYSVSCAAAGSCAAGGTYRAGSHFQAFVVTETKGHWNKAIEVPRTAFLNKGGNASIGTVSCPATGSCAADGYYINAAGHFQAFVVTEANGRWGKAIQAPGTAALDQGRTANIGVVSCAAAGSCAAGGGYTDRSGHIQAFVLTEAKGRWGQASEVPGTAALNKGGNSEIYPMSCPIAGGCAAGGYYVDGSGHTQTFMVTETKGRWGKAIATPGLATLNKGGSAQINTVSCAVAGSCAAGGRYTDSSGHYQAFLVTQTKGHWGNATGVPGLAALNKGYAQINSLSCMSALSCAAGGLYQDGSGHYEAFVVSRS